MWKGGIPARVLWTTTATPATTIARHRQAARLAGAFRQGEIRGMEEEEEEEWYKRAGGGLAGERHV